MKERMFEFITKTWNPLGGECLHKCLYCWSQSDKGLVKMYKLKKYVGSPRIDRNVFNRKFSQDDFVFVQDMSDLLAKNILLMHIREVLFYIRKSEATFLLLTKNPVRYFELYEQIPPNCVLGCTIESNFDFLNISKAPNQSDRLYWMTRLADVMQITHGNKLFVAIEPILEFDLIQFFNMLANWIKPWAVAIGYDNYDNHLPEPSLAKTLQLIDRLEKAGITVYRKTLREAWKA